MKFALVVASGVHQGKEIAVPGASLVIGRADGCHLRPASPAISNKHCEVFSKDGGVFVRDLGSTNGTLLNDQPVTGDVRVNAGDRLKVGPLDFTVKIAGKSDSTPLPDALKAVNKTASAASTGTHKAVPKPAAQAPAAPPKPKPAPAAKDTSDDDMAAMLLGMDDDDPAPEVPGGSTVMEMPSVDAAAAAAAAKAAADKKIPTQADSSSAAKDLLNRYTQRPRR